jgi:hypothetical protein
MATDFTTSEGDYNNTDLADIFQPLGTGTKLDYSVGYKPNQTNYPLANDLSDIFLPKGSAISKGNVAIKYKNTDLSEIFEPFNPAKWNWKENGGTNVNWFDIASNYNNSNIVGGTGNATVFYSSNGGVSIVNAGTGALSSTGGFSCCSSQTGDKAWCAPYSNLLYFTTNYGVSWSSNSSSGDRSWSKIACSGTGDIVYAVASFDGLYKGNSGVFAKVNGNTGLNGVCCSTDGSIVYMTNYSGGGVFKSTDSATSFSTIISGGSYLNCSCSGDGSNVLVENENGYIYYSTNGGTSFAQGPRSTTGYWTVKVSRNGNTFAGAIGGRGGNGYIYISRDNGLTWTPQGDAGVRNWVGIGVSDDGDKIIVAVNQGNLWTATFY